MKALPFIFLAAFATSARAAEAVPYPEGYRDWSHVKTMIINAGHPLYEAFGGIHHLYANKKALEGYRSGKFADGAVIVFDLIEAKAADNTVQEGARKVVGVMQRDGRRYRETGGWGFEAFKGDSKTERVVAGNAVKACFECHAGQKDKDYVFSAYRK